MTAQQLKLLNFIRAFVAEREYSPSYQEMRAFMGLATASGVHRLVHALERGGHVVIRPHVARSVMPVHRAPTADHTSLAARLSAALMEAHGFDDGEGPLFCATEAELRMTILATLTR